MLKVWGHSGEEQGNGGGRGDEVQVPGVVQSGMQRESRSGPLRDKSVGRCEGA